MSALLLALVAPLLQAAPTPAPPGLEPWSPEDRRAQLALEDALLEAVDPARLRAWHDLVASEPHVAGTPGDRRVVEKLAGAFEAMGLEVERHSIWVLLPSPVSASVEVVSPEPVRLPLAEAAIPSDPDTAHEALTFGWNGFSGSGDVTAEVVYAHHGRLEDFEKLEELGVSCAGKVVVARYGGNYRGYKAKYAEAAGAAALLIFTDPEDSGWGRGLPWPEGGYAHETHVQRGSIMTLPYQGDPLTPGVEATKDAERLDPGSVPLPSIPVQPLSWSAAREILGRMTGPSVPSAWQGGLPFRYRLTGGSELRVRVAVEQSRRVTETFNVVATLRGTEDPEKTIVLGSHHDAWGFGAADPTCGLICVLEAARVLSDAAKAGMPLRRSVAFAGWGAEEMGIIGSSEWVESRRDELRDSAVAYLNLDMAVTGPRFRASASPSLQRVLARVAARVPTVDGSETVLEAWGVDPAAAGGFGDLGGGSDHVGFLAQAGVAAASLSAGGAPGTSYHSNHDTLAWYRATVGDDYEPARMVTRMTALAAARLANAPVLALDAGRAAADARRHLEALTRRGRALGVFDASGTRPVATALARVEAAALVDGERAEALAARLEEAGPHLPDARRRRVDALLLGLDRAWLDPGGLPGRPWFENLFAAPDETSGYAAWMLPLLRHAVEHGGGELLEAAEQRTLAVFDRRRGLLERLEAELEQVPATGR